LWKRKGASRVLVGTPEEKGHLENLGVDGLKRNSMKGRGIKS
jgi:hypothetical protein